MDTDERFRLEAPPCSTKQQVVEEIRRGHAECDRAARRESDHEAFKARAFFVTTGWDVALALDPAEGATLESVVSLLSGRIEQAGRSRLRTDRWWARDLCVWSNGRLVAALRCVDGRPVVTVFRSPNE
jgi:hypothetical protein